MATLNNVHSIKVSPGIGMARVGNSEPASAADRDYFFLGPETPYEVPKPAGGTFKDAQGRVKRQAQRYRVFGYDSSGHLVGEITDGDTVNGTAVSVQWAVYLRNMKSANYAFQGQYGFNPKQLRNSTIQGNLPPEERTQLIIDPGPAPTVSGASQGPVALSGTIFDGVGTGTLPGVLRFDPPQNAGITDPVKVQYTPATVNIGNLYTDDAGRLIVVGGKGESKSATSPQVVLSKITDNTDATLNQNPEYNGNSYFNNPGWFDDTAGGSIDAAVVPAAGGSPLFQTTQADQRGWLAVAPPKYAPATYTVVSLLDLQLDLYPQQDPYTGAGPIALATVSTAGTGGVPAIATSATGAASSLAPQPASPAGSPPRGGALARFQGAFFYASTPVSGPPLIASSPTGAAGSFHFAPASTTGPTAAAPSLAVFQDHLYYAVTANGQPYLASSASGAAGSFTFQAVSSTVTSTAGPAVAAFNGQLYYALSNAQAGNQLVLAASPDGTSFAFSPVPGSIATGQQPAMTVFQGKLFVAVTDSAGTVSLASSLDPLGLNNPQDGGLTFQAIAGSPTTTTGPALAAFNGRLYCAVLSGGQVQLGTSTDGEHFTFAAVPGAAATGVALAINEPVNFYRDIYPILKSVTDYAWINTPAFNGHAPGTQGDFLRGPFLDLQANPATAGSQARSFVFNFLRPPSTPTPKVLPPPAPVVPSDVPDGGVQRGSLMPHLFGNGGSPTENQVNGTNFPNQWLSLTNHQLSKFQRWVNGDFVMGTAGELRWTHLPPDQGADFAALQPTVGGGFHPGIELTYLMQQEHFFDSAFRFKKGTVQGSIAGYMSVPWQGDFWSCNISWWAPARPDISVELNPGSTPPVLHPRPWFRGSVIPPYSDDISTYNGGYQTMADNWPRFGVVVPRTAAPTTDLGEQVFQEEERDPILDRPSVVESWRYQAEAANPFLPVATADVLASRGGGVQASPGNGSTTAQQWRLVASPSSTAFFTLESVAENKVVTAQAGNGAAVTLEALADPLEDAQLWSYVSSDYPTIFFLRSRLNGFLLAVGAGQQVVTAELNTDHPGNPLSLWRLAGPPVT